MDDRTDWGKQDSSVNLLGAAKEAWPYIRVILIIFGFSILAINSLSWSLLQNFERWAWVLMAMSIFMVAHKKGEKNKCVQFAIFYTVGLITALWI